LAIEEGDVSIKTAEFVAVIEDDPVEGLAATFGAMKDEFAFSGSNDDGTGGVAHVEATVGTTTVEVLFG
jgi:hypothetical protein